MIVSFNDYLIFNLNTFIDSKISNKKIGDMAASLPAQSNQTNHVDIKKI